jgi:ferredoxin
MTISRARGTQLRLDPLNCHAHGLCAELLPEIVTLDEWGYPIITDPSVPPGLIKHARRAVAVCPTLALRLAKPEQDKR